MKLHETFIKPMHREGWRFVGVFAVLTLLLFVAFDIDPLVDHGALTPVAVLFFGFGTCTTALTYCLSFLYQSHTRARPLFFMRARASASPSLTACRCICDEGSSIIDVHPARWSGSPPFWAALTTASRCAAR